MTYVCHGANGAHLCSMSSTAVSAANAEQAVTRRSRAMSSEEKAKRAADRAAKKPRCTA